MCDKFSDIYDRTQEVCRMRVRMSVFIPYRKFLTSFLYHSCKDLRQEPNMVGNCLHGISFRNRGHMVASSNMDHHMKVVVDHI